MLLKVFLLCLTCRLSRGRSVPVDDHDYIGVAHGIAESGAPPGQLGFMSAADAPLLLLPPGQSASSDPIPPSPIPPPPAPVASTSIQIVTVTDVVTAPPDTVTVTVAPSPTTSSSATSLPPAPPLHAWAVPAVFADLSGFNVTKFPSGKHNLEIVNGIPASASAASSPSPTHSGSNVQPAWANDSSVLQLFYPMGSINPSNSPQGGSEFYATPLDLRDARNVTMEYSVFFPADFDWVKGGKLPGLYGGHTTCSGGDDALNCFSTRMMWRPDGAGELYLYAPKDQQTKALCSLPPQSICDSTYGLSIGRGAFMFNAGAWTHISQTVSLNTPGEQDGGFYLEVDGKPIINRSDVFYRNPVPPAADPSDADPEEPAPTQLSVDGLLDPLVDGILGTAHSVANGAAEALPPLVAPTPAPGPAPAAPGRISTTTATVTSFAPPQTVTQTLSALAVLGAQVPLPIAVPVDEVDAFSEDSVPDGPIGFSGLFFSTFFGGHESDYATPKDQTVWFKDFGIRINDVS
ncbi:polysaccharide lyase family 14 protein [Auriscalpium vulgare]|uniref:Polysaccharide lyase family 14 protein n=1 Tax=Auriscalpium vulgare TaxID=40419 RepID=A0ACB8RTI8_9AGAM|nr:polysaccharide lyase family 14 protein [Auriscalpium vulgare]